MLMTATCRTHSYLLVLQGTCKLRAAGKFPSSFSAQCVKVTIFQRRSTSSMTLFVVSAHIILESGLSAEPFDGEEGHQM